MWNRMSRWFTQTEHSHLSSSNVTSGVARHLKLTASQDERPEQPLLLNQLHSYWQEGNWDALSRIGADELRMHPDRAKLALLVAAANEQSGQTETAAEFLQIAKAWGASNREIAKLLVSAVHATLGRAWLVTGSSVKATNHFAKALPAKNSPVAAQTSADARMMHEARMLNLPEKLTKSLRDPQQKPTPAPPDPELTITLENLSREIKTSIKSEVRTAMRQLEAYISIQSYLIHGHLSPALHGWPVSPDFGHYIIQSLETSQYDLVIEFGSGTSTLLIASALQRIQKKTSYSDKPTAQVAFEHLQKYFEKTAEALERFDLKNSVRLVLAKLGEYRDESDKKTYSYYECEQTISEIANTIAPQRILVIVDGPPASTGKHARYSALPLILKYFPKAELDVMLDDYERQDEKEIVQKWIGLLNGKSRTFQQTILNFEKGGVHLKIEHTS